MVTYAQIKDGVYIRASGNAPDSATQARLLAAVSTIRVVR